MLQQLRAALRRGRSAGYYALTWNEDFGCLEQGGGGYWVLPSYLVIGMGGGGGGRVTDEEQYRVISGSGFGWLAFGLLLDGAPGVNFLPYIGLGGGGAGTVRSERAALEAGQNVTKDPARRTESGGGGPLLRIGMTLEFRLGGKNAALVGVDVGMAFALGIKPWRYVRLLGGWARQH